MREIFINEITIQDFGPYYGLNQIDLRPIENRRCILIGGKNGVGKTSLLKSIYLSVVGEIGKKEIIEFEQIENKSSRATFGSTLNRKAKKDGKDISVLSIVIKIVNHYSGSNDKYRFTRVIKFSNNQDQKWTSYLNHNKYIDYFDLACIQNDVETEKDDEKINHLRDQILPVHLAQFFFFDAEKSQTIELTNTMIVEGVSKILGLWNYKELSERLHHIKKYVLTKQYQHNKLDNLENEQFQVSEDINKYEHQIKQNENLIHKLENEKEENELELNIIENNLNRLNNVNPDEVQQKNEAIKGLKSIENEIKTQITSALDYEIPINFVSNLSGEFLDQLEKEFKRLEWDQNKKALEPRIPKVIDDVFCNTPTDYGLDKQLKEFYIQRLVQSLTNIFYPPPLGLAEEVYLSHNLESNLKIRQSLNYNFSILPLLSDMLSELENTSNKISALEHFLKQVTPEDIDEVIKLRVDYNVRKHRIDDLKKQIDKMSYEITEIKDKLTPLHSAEKKLVEQINKARKGETLSTMAYKYAKISDEVKTRATSIYRQNISDAVGSLWLDIANRTNEFESMVFDENWDCKLKQINGEYIPWHQVNASAGQKQIRILAFNETLRREAKLVPPLVVDTPLGRLDSEIRNSVLKQIYLKGHQTIVLSTDTEISPRGQLLRDVAHEIARVYTLHSVGDPQSNDYRVEITNDYFGENL